jgi:N-acetylated-alpha-linked acidic dipeptidase
MGSGSDFTPFQDFAGIPSIDFGFHAGPKDPVYHYHSNYDSFWWMDHYGDSAWHYHVAIAKILALTAANLVETPVLAFNATDYARSLHTYLESVEKRVKEDATVARFRFTPLEKATAKLFTAAECFDAYTASLTDRLAEDIPWWKWWMKVRLYYEVKRANEKYKLFERQFLYPGGLDDRSWFKHVVFAPGRWTGYAGVTYPGLVESLQDANMTNAERWRDIILSRLHAAAEILR